MDEGTEPGIAEPLIQPCLGVCGLFQTIGKAVLEGPFVYYGGGASVTGRTELSVCANPGKMSPG